MAKVKVFFATELQTESQTDQKLDSFEFLEFHSGGIKKNAGLQKYLQALCL